MVKFIDCPLCNGGKLKIDISNGYKIVTSGALSELPCIVVCKTCNRRVKYKVVKEDENQKQ
jgi:hypothetical protein